MRRQRRPGKSLYSLTLVLMSTRKDWAVLLRMRIPSLIREKFRRIGTSDKRSSDACLPVSVQQSSAFWLLPAKATEQVGLLRTSRNGWKPHGLEIELAGSNQARLADECPCTSSGFLFAPSATHKCLRRPHRQVDGRLRGKDSRIKHSIKSSLLPSSESVPDFAPCFRRFELTEQSCDRGLRVRVPSRFLDGSRRPRTKLLHASILLPSLDVRLLSLSCCSALLARQEPCTEPCSLSGGFVTPNYDREPSLPCPNATVTGPGLSTVSPSIPPAREHCRDARPSFSIRCSVAIRRFCRLVTECSLSTTSG